MAAKKKGGKKAAKRSGGTKKAAKKSGAKKAKKSSGRKPNAAFMKPVQPNEKLAAIVGPGAMPRTELTKKLWAYIRKNNLQDKKNRRMINADDKMKALFGGKSSASMFELTKYASKNLSK
jgi:chromatin remodeling complex protein RSC6